MKKNNVIKYILTIVLILVLTTIYLLPFQKIRFTIIVGLNLQSYDSNLWGHISYVELNSTMRHKNNNDNIKLNVKYPDEIINSYFIIQIHTKDNIITYSYDYIIKDQIKFNGIYKGEVYLNHYVKRTSVLNITLTMIENNKVINADSKIYKIIKP